VWNGRLSEKRNSKPPVEILVIDDDAIMRDLISDWLEAAGYAVRKAGNCTAAVAALEQGAPSLVVSDMWMPGPCGAEAIHSMREKHPGLKVIAVSGHFNSDQGCSAHDALQAGAARALAKPVKRAELLRAVAELVGPAHR
jgi:two-component system, NtrC family, nitrogen regulation response regulator NtrX